MRFFLLISCPVSMNCADWNMLRQQPARYALIFFCLLQVMANQAYAGDDTFDFDPDAYARKSLQWSGFVEGKFEHLVYNEDGIQYFLNFPDGSGSALDRLTGTLQFSGSYSMERASFNWMLKGAALQDQDNYDDWVDIFEAYVRLLPGDNLTVEVGKQAHKWGTGYAWNPAGFLNRPKDPNNPDEDLEGFTTLELSSIQSFGSTLESLALSVSMLPVWKGVNEDFGRKNHVNLAVKLYLLVGNTDMDFIWYTGDSRSSRYGIDFAANLATNFAIHGEFAWVPENTRAVLGEDGSLAMDQAQATSWLLGLRYLSEQNITTILEYYHNGAGYTREELDRFYMLASEAGDAYLQVSDATLFEKALLVSRSGYGAYQAGRNYGYARITWKEPFDIVYFTPAVTALINLDDSSWTLTPELLYTGFTNWELRLRFSLPGGEEFSEYGEKLSRGKVELRIRYFF